MEHNVDILQKIYKIRKVAKVIGSCIYAKQNILILGNSKKYVILTKFAKFKTDYHHKSVNRRYKSATHHKSALSLLTDCMI